MEKELIDLLKKQGEASLAHELKFDDITVEDFIEKHRDELLAVPGFVDLMQPQKESNAPHGMNEEQKESYFYNDPKGKAEYEASEAKLNADMNEKTKLAEEYSRSKDGSYFNTPVANEFARKDYIEGKPVQAAINEAAGKAAGVLDFAPWPLSVGGPAIRTAQKLAHDEPVITTETGVDWAAGIIPFGKYGKEGYNAIKAVTGKAGQFFDKSKLGEKIKKTADAMDSAAKRAEEERAAAKTLAKTERQTEFTLKEISDMANEVPELRQPLIDFYKSAQTPADLAKLRKEAGDIWLSKEITLKPGSTKTTLTGPATDKIISSSIDAAAITNPGTVKALDAAGRGIIRKGGQSFASSDNAGKTKASEVEKEYDKAIDKTIDLYKRQWKAGFVPRAGFELEAYNVAKSRGEI